MTEGRRIGQRRERGATLVLVLVFTLVTGIVVSGLLTALTGDLANSQNLAAARSLQYDASTAVDLAIQSIRYTPLLAPGQTLNASPPQPCWGAGPGGAYGSAHLSHSVSPDGIDIAVWCSTAWYPTSASTRIVTFSACEATTSGPACARNPVLQSVVTFDDYPSGVTSPTYGQCVVYCGTGLTVDSWLLYPTVPTVTALSSYTGSVGGGVTITVTGTGFAPNSTVGFVEESAGKPTTDNVVVRVAATTVDNSTSLEVKVPPIIEGSDYFVTVATPTGTSAYGPVYTYAAARPQITGVTSTPGTRPLGGPSTGGTAITITGSNFVVGDTVTFLQSNGASVVGATSVSVSRTAAGNTVITALAPPIVAGTTYYVSVSSPTFGPATNGSQNLFTYQTVIPTVNVISPTAGNSSTPIQIYGTGFQTNAVVSFVPENNGQPQSGRVTATNVTYTSSVLISATPPALQKGTTYFVTVSIPGVKGRSSYFPVLTGS